MKKDVLKKIAVVFSFISITIANTVTCTPAASTIEQDKQFLNNITTKIENFVVSSSNWMNQFLNKNNSESYNTHVDRLQTKLSEFNRSVVQALKNHHSTAEYNQIVNIIKNIVTLLYNQANNVCSVFNQYRGNSSAISLGLALQKATNKYSAKQLENQLIQVQKLLHHIDSHLANKVARIIAQSKKQERDINSRSSLAMLSALRHRVNCKGASTVVIASTATTQVKSANRAIAKKVVARSSNRSTRIAQRRARIAALRARRARRR